MERGGGNGVDSFKQQELKSWQPVLTPVAVIAVLLGVALVFMPIGIVLRDASEDVISYKKRYDNIAECEVTDDMNVTELPRNCTINITIEDDMDGPIYFYYELHNYYQNHRRYLKSFNDDQLMGDGNNDVTDCEPLKTHNSKKLVACGLVAGSFFLDRFNMYINGENLCGSNCTNYGKNNEEDWSEYWQDWYSEPNWAKDGIAWESDVDEKFGISAIDNSSQTQYGERQIKAGLRLPDTDDEDFIVWMRVAALPDFRKLHRIVRDKDIKKGDNVTVLFRVLLCFFAFCFVLFCFVSNHFFSFFFLLFFVVLSQTTFFVFAFVVCLLCNIIKD